jgi:hypothetical protein
MRWKALLPPYVGSYIQCFCPHNAQHVSWEVTRQFGRSHLTIRIFASEVTLDGIVTTEGDCGLVPAGSRGEKFRSK